MAKLTQKDKELLCAMSIEIENNKNKYTQQELADYFGISKGMVNRYIKEKVNKSKQIIDKEVRLKQELAEIENEKVNTLSKQEIIEVNKQVEDRTKHLIYFQNSALKNQEKANKALEYTDKMQEIEAHSRITKNNKETILGKDPDTIINNTNAQQNNVKTLDDFYEEIDEA